MKTIVLTDCNKRAVQEMAQDVDSSEILIIDTLNCDEEYELESLLTIADGFSKSKKKIMLVKFSGRELIVQNFGDEVADMVICLSHNKESKYYTERPVELFSDMVKLFDEV